jgi:hypothetical protein
VSTLTVAAHAKLNLSLRVLAREETGYHSLETLFLRLELADELTIRTGGVDLDLEVSGDPEVPVREANLCWQAAELLGRTIGRPIQAAVELRKRIPIGAGLGGGSADAGAVLQALNAALRHPDCVGRAARKRCPVRSVRVAHGAGMGAGKEAAPAGPTFVSPGADRGARFHDRDA